MHDCRKTKEDLIDLVFNEVEAARELHVLEDVEACRACRAEYRSMMEALDGFDEATQALIPSGEFWTHHHAKLEERLDCVAGARAGNVVPFWRRAARTSFSVPVPVGIAAALLLMATSVVAIRSFLIQPKANQAAASPASQTRAQVVEVPVEKRVVEERVVTRTVYVTKRVQQNAPPAPTVQSLPDMTANNSKGEGVNPGARSTLSGFQPPGDVKLTVIKGSYSDDK